MSSQMNHKRNVGPEYYLMIYQVARTVQFGSPGMDTASGPSEFGCADFLRLWYTGSTLRGEGFDESDVFR